MHYHWDLDTKCKIRIATLPKFILKKRYYPVPDKHTSLSPWTNEALLSKAVISDGPGALMRRK